MPAARSWLVSLGLHALAGVMGWGWLAGGEGTEPPRPPVLAWGRSAVPTPEAAVPRFPRLSPPVSTPEFPELLPVPDPQPDPVPAPARDPVATIRAVLRPFPRRRREPVVQAAPVGAPLREEPSPAPTPAIPAAAPATPGTAGVPEGAVAVATRAPAYPRLARRQGWEGVVRVRVQVAADGQVLAASVARSSGYEVLDEAALAAVRGWRFRPARDAQGRPRADMVEVPVRFRLEGGG